MKFNHFILLFFTRRPLKMNFPCDGKIISRSRYRDNLLKNIRNKYRLFFLGKKIKFNWIIKTNIPFDCELIGFAIDPKSKSRYQLKTEFFFFSVFALRVDITVENIWGKKEKFFRKEFRRQKPLKKTCKIMVIPPWFQVFFFIFPHAGVIKKIYTEKFFPSLVFLFFFFGSCLLIFFSFLYFGCGLRNKKR